MLLVSAFSKENSPISLKEWVLVFKVFTTATRKLGVKVGGGVCVCVWRGVGGGGGR